MVAAMELASFLHMRPAWTASSGDPVPPAFKYAMFPVRDGVVLYDAPNGAPVGTLDRAVANSQAEIESGGWIRVVSSPSDRWVPLTELAYLPPSGSRVDYFKSFAEVYHEQIEDGSGRAALAMTSRTSGSVRITLRLAQAQEDDLQLYVYEVSQGGATPVEMYTIDGIRVGFAGAGITLMGWMAYFVIVIAWVVVRFLRTAKTSGEH